MERNFQPKPRVLCFMCGSKVFEPLMEKDDGEVFCGANCLCDWNRRKQAHEDSINHLLKEMGNEIEKGG